MTNPQDPPVVLVVDDEHDLADLYAAWLTESCTVRTAYDGTDALDALDESVDVVLLDRQMPTLDGDEVLAEIGSRDVACRVAMVTAVAPEFDVIEMGFDDYLVKPVSRTDLQESVDRLLARSAYDGQVDEYFALVSKKALLDAEKSAAARNASDEYARLERDLEAARERLDEASSTFEDDDFHALLRDVQSDGPAAGDVAAARGSHR